MKQTFFDHLDGGWGDVIADTYKDASNIIILKPFTGNNNKKYIGYHKFYKNYLDNKNPLKHLEIVEGTDSIKNSAFAGCSDIESILFPDGLKLIDFAAFSECEKLKIITFNGSVDNIGPIAFEKCENLKTVNFSNKIKVIEDSAFANVGLEGDLILPKGLKRLGSFAFEGCKNLTGKLELPEKLNRINRYTFRNCSFTGDLVIPEKLKYIGTGAFAGCNFDKIYVKKDNHLLFKKYWDDGCNAEIVYY